VYGEGDDLVTPIFAVEPEDARAIVLEAFPKRVNHARNPCFASPISTTNPESWVVSSGQVSPATANDLQRIPFGITSGLRVNAGTQMWYGSLTRKKTSIWVSPKEPSGADSSTAATQHNWWKIALVMNDHDNIRAGFIVRDRSGGTHYVTTTDPAEPLPWDIDEDSVAASFQAHVHASGDAPSPVLSNSGWYVLYGVLDLGMDAEWAVPFIQSSSTSALPTVVTGVTVERVAELDFLTGPAILPQNQRWKTADLLRQDHIVVFDGNSKSRGSDDYIWLGDPASSVSGYYPQRVSRAGAMKDLMYGQTPVGRTISLRYVYETP
jgi:hypothetical protein